MLVTPLVAWFHVDASGDTKMLPVCRREHQVNSSSRSRCDMTSAKVKLDENTSMQHVRVLLYFTRATSMDSVKQDNPGKRLRNSALEHH